jgi:hypothetical protein
VWRGRGCRRPAAPVQHGATARIPITHRPRRVAVQRELDGNPPDVATDIPASSPHRRPEQLGQVDPTGFRGPPQWRACRGRWQRTTTRHQRRVGVVVAQIEVAGGMRSQSGHTDCRPRSTDPCRAWCRRLRSLDNASVPPPPAPPRHTPIRSAVGADWSPCSAAHHDPPRPQGIRMVTMSALVGAVVGAVVAGPGFEPG